MAAVAVILLNYDNYDPDTRRCLASLQRIPAPRLQAVVVDNGSRHPCTDRVAQEFPDAEVLPLARNLGFAGGNNRGIAWALERDFEYVLVLNNDTEIVDVDLIADMVTALNENERMALVGPRVLDAHEGGEQSVLLPPQYRTLREWVFARPGHTLDALAPGTVSVEGISAVCWLAQARTFRELGLMDEGLFIYAEDDEYCYRVRNDGRLIGQYRDRIGIRHYLTSTRLQSLTSARHQLTYVNRLYALRKHGSSVPVALAYAVGTSLRMLRHLLTRSPKRRYGREIGAYARIVGNLFRQLAMGRRSIHLRPSDA